MMGSSVTPVSQSEVQGQGALEAQLPCSEALHTTPNHNCLVQDQAQAQDPNQKKEFKLF